MGQRNSAAFAGRAAGCERRRRTYDVLVTTAPRPATRVHALWTLDGIDSLDWPTASAALRDAEPRVAAAGVRVSERFIASHPERTIAAMLERAALE